MPFRLILGLAAALTAAQLSLSSPSPEIPAHGSAVRSAPSDPFVAPLTIVASSAESGHVVAGASVTMRVGSESFTGTTGIDGLVAFPQIPYTPNLPAILAPDGQTLVDARMRVTVTVTANDYLPLKKEHIFFEHDRRREMRLNPVKTGFTTSVINAAKGGRLSIPKLGTLSVDPDALLQNTRLRVAVIPAETTSPSLVEGVLRLEVWLQAIDGAGHPAPGLIATQGGITLETTLADTEIEPAGAQGDWRSLHVGTAYTGSSWSPVVFDAPANRATMPLREGYNLLDRRYGVPDSTGWAWGPWELTLTHIATTVSVGEAQAAILCGHYIHGASHSVSAGTTIEGSATLSAEVAAEAGWSANLFFGKLSAKLGLKVSGSLTGSVALTTTTEDGASVSNGDTINGQPARLSPPFSCVSGTAHLSSIWKTHRVYATRWKTCNGQIAEGESRLIGSVGLFHHTMVWFDVQRDASCPGCANAGTLPSLPGDPTWSDD